MEKTFDLEQLADPRFFHEQLDLRDLGVNELFRILASMIRIREVELCLAMHRREGDIGGPVHLGVGQEAVAVGISQHLTSADFVFGAHRSHAHLLALGGDIRKLLAEVLGKVTGHSRGMGGSMHLWDQSVGFSGSVPIVAGTVPIAAGAALSCKLRGSSSVAVSYLGDGAVEEGVVHETFNLASLYELPIIFVVENNLFASHMHISTRQKYNSTARFAEANAIPSYVVDGNDAIEMSFSSKEAVDRARDGKGPSLIEAVTYRWLGHVDWREDIDVGVQRSATDVENWKARDPISRLATSMIQAKFLDQAELLSLEHDIRHEVMEAWERASSDPYPDPSTLLDHVYSAHLAEDL